MKATKNMGGLPRISVIIPVKNRANLIVHTLDNILAQTLKPLEIIVVDDGSEDNLTEVLERYKESVLYLKNDGKGPGAARNTGLKAASGNLIQFFDSDDLMTLNKLEVQSDLLFSSGKGMIYGPYVKALLSPTEGWKQLDVVMNYQALPAHKGMDIWGLRGWCIITQACMFEHDLLKEVGPWRTDLMPHEDKEYLYRVGKLVRYPLHECQTGVIYRQHGAQITEGSTNEIHRAFDCIAAYLTIEKQISSEPDVLSKLIFQSRIYNTIMFLYKQNQDVSPYVKYLTNRNKFNSLIHRMYSKLERLKSNSCWETMHGVNHSTKVFDNIINLVA